MRRIHLTQTSICTVSACLALSLLLSACNTNTSDTGASQATSPAKAAATHGAASVAELSVQETAAKLENTSTFAVDANSATVRHNYGVIPKALMLSSSSRYDVAKELPKDKSTGLIFYCSNQECGASHSAAKRALKAGFQDVSVMKAGITGWKKAGQSTSPVQSAG